MSYVTDCLSSLTIWSQFLCEYSNFIYIHFSDTDFCFFDGSLGAIEIRFHVY